jgi:Tfp pilus assembly protein PilV
MKLRRTADKEKVRNPEAGITMIETLIAGAILVIGSIGMLSLIVDAIATNNRNKIDSTQTMLAESILEQIASAVTLNAGISTSTLVDCAGTTWTIYTTSSSSGSSGAPLLGGVGTNIDFSQSQTAACDVSGTQCWYMNYVVSSPCQGTLTGATVQGTYDVRWHLDRLGPSTNYTNSYMITVAARLKGQAGGNKFFSLPTTLKVIYSS